MVVEYAVQMTDGWAADAVTMPYMAFVSGFVLDQ